MVDNERDRAGYVADLYGEVASTIPPMATTTTRRRKRQPAPVRHDAGSDASIELVRGFVRQEARRRVRREDEREIARRLLNRERRRLI